MDSDSDETSAAPTFLRDWLRLIAQFSTVLRRKPYVP